MVEYLNHFYVMEGHKRVSVLKYFGAITIPATVTRLLPKPSDDPEVAAYYEFLDFYKMTGLNFIGLPPARASTRNCWKHWAAPTAMPGVRKTSTPSGPSFICSGTPTSGGIGTTQASPWPF